jgi:hypothetical protein
MVILDGSGLGVKNIKTRILEIKLDEGEMKKITGKDITYEPELIIETDKYRIHWSWVLVVWKSTPEGCKATPGIIYLYEKNKNEVTSYNENENPDEYNILKTKLEDLIGSAPSSLVINKLIEQTRFF